jgi:F-type H+-transporting ATPase subunit alpha
LLNTKHRDSMDALKAGKLTDEVIDVLTQVAKDLSSRY